MRHMLKFHGKVVKAMNPSFRLDAISPSEVTLEARAGTAILMSRAFCGDVEVISLLKTGSIPKQKAVFSRTNERPFDNPSPLM